MATLLPLEDAAVTTCFRVCDFPAPAIPETFHHQVPRYQDVFERLALLFGEFRLVQLESRSYRFAGIPSASDEIQESFLLKFRLFCSKMRTVELYEPICRDMR